MLGRNHAWCGVVAGCATASLFAPHERGWFELLQLVDGDGVGYAVRLGLGLAGAVVASVLLPGMALPAGALPDAPPVVLGVIVATTGGAALLPDLDHPRAYVARSLGPVTRGLAWAIDRAALGIYDATRGPADRERQGGHRLVTHTVPGALAFGVIALALMALPPVTLPGTAVSVPLGAIVPGLLAALLALGAPAIGTTFASLAATGSVIVFLQHSAWVPVLAAAVTVGCLAHVAGDAVTLSGVPLRWPLERDGQRWAMVGTRQRFRVGSRFERIIVGPAVMSVAAVSVVTGVASAAGVLA